MKLNDPTLLVERCYVGGAWIGDDGVTRTLTVSKLSCSPG
jgi:hypothetical protein